MQKQSLKGALQALLFASGEPLSIDRIAQVLALSPQQAESLALEEQEAFNAQNEGIQILRLEDSFQMCSAPLYAEQVRNLLEIKHNAPLSQAARCASWSRRNSSAPDTRSWWPCRN